MRFFGSECIALRVAAMAFLVAVCGCERDAVAPKEATGTNVVRRAKDPEYQKALKDVQVRRREIATERMKVLDEMKEMAEKILATLPKGTTYAQVKAELDGQPQKYPEWQDLVRRLREVEAKAKRDLSDAQGMVRERILREQKDLDSQQKRGGSK